jgi:hypothetical protein
VKTPKIASAHDPMDMGDQYLNIGSSVFRAISMCQKRSGLPTSIVSRNPQIRMSGKARKKPTRASFMSSWRPTIAINVARK